MSANAASTCLCYRLHLVFTLCTVHSRYWSTRIDASHIHSDSRTQFDGAAEVRQLQQQGRSIKKGARQDWLRRMPVFSEALQTNTISRIDVECKTLACFTPTRSKGTTEIDLILSTVTAPPLRLPDLYVTLATTESVASICVLVQGQMNYGMPSKSSVQSLHHDTGWGRMHFYLDLNEMRQSFRLAQPL